MSHTTPKQMRISPTLTEYEKKLIRHAEERGVTLEDIFKKGLSRIPVTLYWWDLMEGLYKGKYVRFKQCRPKQEATYLHVDMKDKKLRDGIMARIEKKEDGSLWATVYPIGGRSSITDRLGPLDQSVYQYLGLVDTSD